jgi:2-oxoglutarate ferredoxin oxidoreductase subunit alpha
VPSFVTTSGGGFALMTEGVSLAAMMELPLVILNAQRPGPATSLPTRTGQQDLLFALHAGHGEFVRALYAPGTVQQCYEVTRHAIAQAHRYQSPVIILTDQYLQDLAQNMPPLDAKLNPIDPCLACNAGAEYQRYVVTVDGVSPRAIPGGAARVVMDSDEHTEAGHLTEDLQEHLRQQDKRMRKGAGLAADALAPEYYGPVNANHLLIAWGSSYGPCREAVDQLPGTAMLHFAQVWPLDVEALKQLLSGRRITVVEGNCTGQFAQVLRLAGLALEYDSLLRYDGMPLTAEYLVERLEA